MSCSIKTNMTGHWGLDWAVRWVFRKKRDKMKRGNVAHKQAGDSQASKGAGADLHAGAARKSARNVAECGAGLPRSCRKLG
jgi:hypothetical protein